MVNSLPSKQTMRVRFSLSAKKNLEKNRLCQGIAQPGSAPVLGTGGRRFESYYPDYYIFKQNLKALCISSMEHLLFHVPSMSSFMYVVFLEDDTRCVQRVSVQ